MTGLELAHQTRARHDGGSETDAKPCLDRWFVYDVLIDHRGGPLWRNALDTAREICSSCPMWLTCLRDNADEEWARAVTTNRSLHAAATEPAA